mmetsp:Transcript_25118/g.65836  ORF Transcript_25118/g.65836 Transcript_25118/m.65836 type:complete len:175 (+) Transcript_25118:1406-1930(+)
MVKKEPCAVKRLLGLPLKRTSSDHGVARRHRTRDDADRSSDGSQLPTYGRLAEVATYSGRCSSRQRRDWATVYDVWGATSASLCIQSPVDFSSSCGTSAVLNFNWGCQRSLYPGEAHRAQSSVGWKRETQVRGIRILTGTRKYNTACRDCCVELSWRVKRARFSLTLRPVCFTE